MVGQTYHDAREGYFPQGYTVKAGLVHMDGDTALWYSRSRRETTGDLDRLRRSQEVLVAIGRKIIKPQRAGKDSVALSGSARRSGH